MSRNFFEKKISAKFSLCEKAIEELGGMEDIMMLSCCTSIIISSKDIIGGRECRMINIRGTFT
jgi:hypothetical protein